MGFGLLGALLAVMLVGVAITLLDLRKRDVRHLPKWGWALIIVFVQFPLGAIVYLTVGRVPPGESAEVAEDRAPTQPHPTAATLVTAPRTPPATAPPAGPERGAPPVVTTSGLTKRYGDTVALDAVDLEVPAGTTYGLIGPNGAGKTTMLSILAGLRRPTSGEVHLSVDRRRIAVLVDTPLFEPWLTAYEVVDLARHLADPALPGDRVDAALARVGLTAAGDRRTGGFSRGMLQRLGIASCLVGEPAVVVLDEPSSALDPAGRREVLDLVGRLAPATTVLLSTHILSDVQQVCDVVGVIDRGVLRYQGPISDLLARTASAYAVHVRTPAGDLVRALAAQPWVDEVEEFAPGRLRITTSDAAQAEHTVPRLVADLGLPLVSFHPATDLETAFLELTG